MTTTMQKWEITAPGDANLRLVTAAKPSPQPGEILLEVDAVALNYRERWIIDGGMGDAWEPPLTLGSDVAGRVVAVGDQVTRFAVGDRVIDNDMVGWLDGDAPPPDAHSFQLGRLAQYVTAPADWFSAAPRSLDTAAASTLPVAGLTAWMALVELGKLRAGQTVVVQGTGGVALFAVQFAAAMGARVILTSSSDAKLERARALGATDVINRQHTPAWHQAVRDLTAGRGADHILEMAGGDNVQKSLEAVAVGGRISLVGLLDAPDFRLSIVPLLFRRASIIGIGVGHRRALEDMVRAVDRLGLTPVIDAHYRFAELPQAMAHLRRGAFGKIVVHVCDAGPAAA
jgi:NADPH:quinone reductase-like Zn-dependent oxidoreductase